MPKFDPYGLTSPCGDCPFRTDVDPYLRSARVKEIEQSLVRVGFACHKTTKFDAVTGEHIHNDEQEKQCAGMLIMLEKLQRPSQLMRTCERLGLYDRTKLDMHAPVFSSFEEMAAAQPLP